MPVSLGRRIRRIGLLPTTYKVIKESRLGHDETGAETEVIVHKKIPQRHLERLSEDTRAGIEAALRAEAKAKRLAARK